MLQQGFTVEGMEGLSGEAAGGPAGGDDSYDSGRFGGRVQAAIMGFETLGKFLRFRQLFAKKVTDFSHD